MPLVAGLAAAALAHAIAPASPLTPAPATHIVRRGDTSYDIARRAGVPLRDLIAANALPLGGRHLVPGARLVIPMRAAAPTTARPVAAHHPAAARPTASHPAAPRPATSRRPAPAGRHTPAPARRTDPTSQAQVRALVARVAAEHGVDPRLAQALALQESSWRQDVTSPVGARGIMQVMPANAAWASRLAGRPLDLARPRDNVTAGVVILKQLRTAAGDDDTAIGGYYQGLPSIRQRGMYAETRRYVAQVEAHRSRM